MNKAWCITVETYEESDPRPVVTHKFWGDTKEEAEGVYQAHLKSDAFFRACASPEGGTFEGRFKCRSKAWIQGP